MNPRRGEVYLVDLKPVKRSEQENKQQAVIIQNNQGNTASTTTIIAPMTSSQQKTYPFQVDIDSSDSFLDRDSTVLLNQIRTVSIKHRLERKLGALSKDKMREIDRAIKISLGLN